MSPEAKPTGLPASGRKVLSVGFPQLRTCKAGTRLLCALGFSIVAGDKLSELPKRVAGGLIYSVLMLDVG